MGIKGINLYVLSIATAAAIGGWGLYWSASRAVWAHKSPTWPTVTGEIVASNVSSFYWEGGESYSPTVKYLLHGRSERKSFYPPVHRGVTVLLLS